MKYFTVEELANLQKVLKILGSGGGSLSKRVIEVSDIRDAMKTSDQLVKIKLQSVFPPELESEVA